MAFFHATEHKNQTDLMEDFASVAHEHSRRGGNRDSFRHGLYIFSATIPLDDYNKARNDNPQVPVDAYDILIREVFFRCVEWGSKVIGAREYHLIFDDLEPYRGYVCDWKRNPKALKEYPMLNDCSITKGNMRKTPGLQLADLFAFSHSNRSAQNGNIWHQMVMGVDQHVYDFSYEDLLIPVEAAIEKRDYWKLPKRAATK